MNKDDEEFARNLARSIGGQPPQPPGTTNSGKADRGGIINQGTLWINATPPPRPEKAWRRFLRLARYRIVQFVAWVLAGLGIGFMCGWAYPLYKKFEAGWRLWDILSDPGYPPEQIQAFAIAGLLWGIPLAAAMWLVALMLTWGDDPAA